jgi:hypothetical protein
MMSKTQIILTPDYETIKPSLTEVATIMGYSPGTEPSFVPEMLAILLEEASSHVSAGGCYAIFKIDSIIVPQGMIVHSSGSLRCGSKIARQLVGSDSFALFITTTGNSFDEWIKSKATGGDVLAEYLCSSIGSVIADKVADLVQEEILSISTIAGKGITEQVFTGLLQLEYQGAAWNF